jgi:hypothetical protein
MEQDLSAAPRPASIVTFERCYLGALVVGLVNTMLNWSTAMDAMNADPSVAQLGSGFSTTMLIGGTIISILISLTLWYFVARRGATVAKWIVVVLYTLGLLTFLWQMLHGGTAIGLTVAITVLQLVLQTIAVVMLFRPDAKAWFGETAEEPVA